mgnify:CR=1 FL=1
MALVRRAIPWFPRCECTQATSSSCSEELVDYSSLKEGASTIPAVNDGVSREERDKLKAV